MRWIDAPGSITLPGPPLMRGLRHRLLEHARLPLHRDGYALALNSAFTAATGLVYWILAAKTYSARAVGLNSALISSMMFLAGIASLNLSNILVRFLPESGHRTRRRVVWAYAAAGALAVCAAGTFIVGISSWAPRLSFLRSDPGLQAWFVVSTLAWCLFAIQDSVLTALGRAIWVPVENAVFSVVKLGLLAALAALLPLYGIFVSWTIAMLLSVLGVNLVIFARLMRPLSARRDEAVTTLRDRTFARYFAADYACSVAWLSTTNLMPVIVTAAAGPTTNAYWALAYAVALPLYAFAQNIGTSLMLHGTIDRTALPVLARKAALQGARVLVPCVAALVLLAPYVLSLFGGSYAAKSTTVLRLLALGALPNLVLALTLHIARVQRRLRRAMIALGSEAVIALGLATPLLHRFGVTGVGIGWLSAQCIVGVGLLLSWRNLLEFTPREPGPVERAISLDRDPDREAQRSARPAPDVPPAHTGQLPPAHTGQLPPAQTGQLPPSQTGQLPPSQTRRLPASQTRRLPPPHPARPHPVLQKLFDALEQAGVRWMLSRLPSSLAAPSGDIDLLVAPADADGLRDTAAGVGFVPLPGWESAPNLILVRYDRPTDQWLLLDVATTVSFRSPRRWQLPGAAEQILRGRRVRDGLAVPADGDAFWLLLLHCLLDKGVVAPHHRPTLRRLAFAALTSPLAGAVGSAAGSELRPDAIVDAVRSGEWQLLADLGGRLRAELKRRRPGPQRLHVLISRAVEFARKPLLLPRRRGLNLALIGPNGAGKSTAAAALRRHLPFDSRVVYMGMWKASGDTRGGPLIVAEIVTRPLRLWWRYLLAQYHQLRGRLVVFDRYVYEAMLPARPPFVPVKRAYFWFLAHAVPPARTVVVLDVPAHLAYGRKQENPPEELECERRFYGHLARRVPAVELVDAAADADTVCADITAIVWRELASRWQGHRACA